MPRQDYSGVKVQIKYESGTTEVNLISNSGVIFLTHLLSADKTELSKENNIT